MIAVNRINTATVAPNQRIDSLNDSMGHIYPGLHVEPLSNDLHCEALFVKLNRLSFARIFSEKSKVIRRPLSDTSNHEEDYIKLHFQTAGSSLNKQGSKEAYIESGQITACENKSFYTIDTSDKSDVFALSIPRSLAASALPNLENQIMKVFSGHSLHGRLLFNMLHTIHNEFRSGVANVSSTQALESALLELLASVLTDEVDTPEQRNMGNQSWKIEELKALVRENLSNPELTTEFLASEMRMSERHVQTLFAANGTTPTFYIRNRRLIKASEFLKYEPRMPITEVAYRTGFNDSAYFTRCFKQHFSETPKAYRSKFSK